MWAQSLRRWASPSLFVWLLCFPAAAAPAMPLEIDVDGVSVGAFCSLVFRDIEHQQFSLAPEVFTDSRLVSLHIRAGRAEFAAAISAYLDRLGYSVIERGGVLAVSPKVAPIEKPELRETFVYRPRFRDASYLVEQVRGAVPGVSYGNERQVRGSLSSGLQTAPLSAGMSNTPVAQSGGAIAGSPAPNSAASLVDQQADVVVATGKPDDLQKVRRLLDQLDLVGGEVMVRASVFEVQVNDQDTGAVQLAAKVLGSRFSISYGPTVSSNMVNQVSIQSGGLQAVVGALAADTHFKSLSSSAARVQSGKSAVFTAGESDPVLGAVSYQGSSGQPVQSVEYMNAGVILSVRPRTYEDVIFLDLHQEVSSFTETTTGVNNSPTIIKRSLDSSLSMESGEVVLLGGLVADQKTDNRSGLSFLPRWLDTTSKNSDRREVILVLQVERVRIGGGLKPFVSPAVPE